VLEDALMLLEPFLGNEVVLAMPVLLEYLNRKSIIRVCLLGRKRRTRKMADII
jgi:hypothetical protein